MIYANNIYSFKTFSVFFWLHIREGLVFGYNAPNFEESSTAKIASTFEVYDGKTKICPILKLEEQL